MTDDFVRAFLALLAVTNVVPLLPVLQEFTAALPRAEARSYRVRALLEGNAVAVGFLFGAPLLLGALSLTVSDLRIAGGIVLIAYATHDMLFSQARRKRRSVPDDEHPELAPAIAPLGVPLLVGPGTLSLLLVLSEVHGALTTTLALGCNVLINVLVIRVGDRLLGLMGEGTSRAVGKVMSLLLATLGAGMLRAGIEGAISA